MIFKVMCPRCGNKMLCEPRGLPIRKVKRCSFVIHSGCENLKEEGDNCNKF